MLPQHPNRPSSHFCRKRLHRLALCHGFLLSRVEASGNPGAVQITQPDKDLLAFDKEQDYVLRRAAVNQAMRTFVNDVAPDPLAYAGRKRGPILTSVIQSVCWMVSRSWSELPAQAVVAALAIPTTLGGVYLAAQVTELSIYVQNVATMLGLALAIDYSLFMVSRFREELRKGRDVGTAVQITVATSGKAVTFSGLAVAVGLSGLLLFLPFVLAALDEEREVPSGDDFLWRRVFRFLPTYWLVVLVVWSLRNFGPTTAVSICTVKGALPPGKTVAGAATSEKPGGKVTLLTVNVAAP